MTPEVARGFNVIANLIPGRAVNHFKETRFTVCLQAL